MPFVPGEGSEAAIYCSSLFYESEWHNRVSSFRCHQYCKHTIQTEPAVRQKSGGSSKRDMAAVPSPHCSSVLRGFRTGNEQLVPAATGRTEYVFIRGKWFRWYIKHQSRVSFPHTFLVLSPSKGRGSLYWAHMHTRDQKQNKQRPFKYQPTGLLFDWRRYCTAILSSALWRTGLTHNCCIKGILSTGMK